MQPQDLKVGMIIEKGSSLEHAQRKIVAIGTENYIYTDLSNGSVEKTDRLANLVGDWKERTRIASPTVTELKESIAELSTPYNKAKSEYNDVKAKFYSIIPEALEKYEALAELSNQRSLLRLKLAAESLPDGHFAKDGVKALLAAGYNEVILSPEAETYITNTLHVPLESSYKPAKGGFMSFDDDGDRQDRYVSVINWKHQPIEFDGIIINNIPRSLRPNNNPKKEDPK